MNKKILIILFFIFSVFISLGVVCANDVNGDASDLGTADSNDLSVGEDNGNVLNADDDSSFNALNDIINSGSSTVEITKDYTFDNESDADFVGGIEIDKNGLTINGNNHTLDAKNIARFFKIRASNVVINDIILKNGNDSAIIVSGSLTTTNVEFNNCSADKGAAVFVNEKNKYTSENDRFIGNSALNGAIFAYNANATINRGFFKDNNGDMGSAIYAEASSVRITNSLLENNHNNWSSIYVQGSHLDIRNTTFANSTSKYATAIYTSESVVVIKKSRFVNLVANITAGALGFKDVNSINMDGCEFIHALSSKNGGAIFIDFPAGDTESRGSIVINNTVFEECSSMFGGALLQLGGELVLLNSNFTSNHADFNGGAVYLSYTETLMENCVFVKNNVNLTDEDYYTYGGAAFVDYSKFIAVHSKFINNSAYDGSALYMRDVLYHLESLEFNGNDNAIYSLFDAEKSKVINLTGSDNISDDDFGNVIYYSVVRGEGMPIIASNITINITNLPSRYDLRQEGLVTPVKDQGYMGACWAFGSLAALESAVLKAMNYTADFSENNMQNSLLRYSNFGAPTVSEGGVNLLSIAYLVSWLGAFPNDYDTYDELGKISPLITSEADIHVQDVIMLPHTPGNQNSITNVKQLIYQYGAIGGYLLSKSSQSDGNPTHYYNKNTSAEYVPDHLVSNHAICVVGWDDDYSASNFLITPPGNGAWIVKNSWGTDWGDEGYFYVSYYDESLCAFPDILTEYFMAFVLNNTLPYNNNYQYDFSGLGGFDNGGYDKVYYLNSFEAYENDVIAAVGTYFNNANVDYTVEIYVNDEMVYTQSGVSPFAGYHTIKLDKYVSIKTGDRFDVVMTSNSVPVSRPSRVHYNGTCSLISTNHIEWQDLSGNDRVACLKAYTLQDLWEIDNVVEYYSDSKPFIVDVNQANVEVTISFDNITITNITDENGIAVFNLPLLAPGTHPITTTFNGTSVVNTVTVKDTVDVPKEITVGYNVKVNVTATYYDKNGDVIDEVIFPVNNKIGTYYVTFTNYLTNQTVTSKIKVVSRFSGNKNINMYYVDGSRYIFKVYGDDGQPVGKNQLVVVKINSRTFKVRTNANGVAALRIPVIITPGTYTITATYAGQTVKNILKVNRVLASKNVIVKKTAKKFVLKATLKNGKKPLKGKIVVFKFNGKNYKVRTNSAGVAQKVLNQNVIKTLKKGRNYPVLISYYRNTIKSFVLVR